MFAFFLNNAPAMNVVLVTPGDAKFIVPGFNPGMPVINKPPIGLSDQEILAVIAYLQSLGGKVTVTLDSKVWPLAPAVGAQ